MQILHINDQAGVACIFAKYQRLRGDQSKVIRISGDKYGIYEFYKDFVLLIPKESFVENCIREAEHADIIHIHGSISILFEVRKKFGASKRVILHYLGTDIRGLEGVDRDPLPNLFSLILAVVKRVVWQVPIHRKYLNFLAQNLADVVLVATPDLLRLVKNGILVPIPVDTEHFKPNGSQKNQEHDALTINTEVSDIDRALEYCRKNGIKLDIDVYDRTTKPIKYQDMPDFLKRYPLYVDIRYVGELLLENLSSTALQSLACGIRVLNHRLAYLDRMPCEHEPRNVVSSLSQIYLRKSTLTPYIWSVFFRIIRN